MSKKIKLGDYNRLRIVKKVDFGLYLDGGDEGEILLPSRYVPEDAGIGDELDVFIYLDQEERLIATTETPLAKVGDFAYLEVKWVNEYGAFLGWGLMKDIFCPFREQKKRMVLGNSYICSSDNYFSRNPFESCVDDAYYAALYACLLYTSPSPRDCS